MVGELDEAKQSATLRPSSAFLPDWSSLDGRATPAWYSDAKLGVFIHWGLYSAPAWAPPGQYAEWYWEKTASRVRPNPWRERHDALYGPDFRYEDFEPRFRASAFDAEPWAELFKRSGARYAVLTSKHHDGYCLWPSPHANAAYGRVWNSADGAAKRDLVGELATAIRAKGLKFGLYYSLYEWFNPLWIADRPRYVLEHMLPQLKHLVSRYEPSLLFADGEWSLTAEQWRAPELLAWLFNESACAKDVVVNDRWGSDARHRHGDYFTTEYGAGLPDAAHPWEENRGLGKSFGYNRAEMLSDYVSNAELVHLFCDLVSRGGNLLLNVGPTADGRIPVVMQERLTELGRWLKVNGEAIFGSRAAARSCQWSAGARPRQDFAEFGVAFDLPEQIGPETRDGKAVKQFWFTTKGADIYAISTGWLAPKMLIRGVQTEPKSHVSMLGLDIDLAWRTVEDGLEIDLPWLPPQDLPCAHAWVWRISNARFVEE
jgi:alpha-L-fucosidase